MKDFWSILDKDAPGGCWEWTMGTSKGYGVVSVGGKSLKAHRHAFALINGPIPHGMLVCHSCDNRKCCNPEHLWLGNEHSNWHDAIDKGRARLVTAKAFSEHPSAKLTAGQRKEVLQQYANGVAKREIARRFNVADITIRNIIDPSISRERWAIRKAGRLAGTAK